MDADLKCGISSVSFSPYTREDVERFSVMAVTSEQTINHADEPVENGSYDLRLGASGNRAACATCGKPEWKCNGHFGRVELSMPVYHPFYVKALKQLVGSICFTCFSTRMPRRLTYQVTEALKLIARGCPVPGDILSVIEDEEEVSQERSEEIKRLIETMQPIKPNSYTVGLRATLQKEFLNKASAYRQCCANCQTTNQKVRFDKASFGFQRLVGETKGPVTLEIMDVRNLLDKFYECNKQFFDEFFTDVGPSMFFLDSVCVTPTKFRPASYLRDKVSPHPSTSAISEIVKAQKLLKKAIDAQDEGAIKKEHMNLQDRVNAFFDKTLAKNSQKLPHGIRQILEKKEGLFRKNLMGKRVNYSARSVIAPDPYIATDEIGVPEVFAKTLSYPERVTEFNKDKLAQMVINGPDRYPGANYIIGSDGTPYKLAGMDEAERKHRANMLYSKMDGPFPMTVCRHVIDGDYVLINRQPTLHRVSILGMKCRVLPNQKTLRMHYSNCASFNADFDGDEINLHLPQNELGRSEVKNLSLSSIHYVTPTAGKPIRGLIQDHVDSGALLTLKDKFFTQAQYQQLVFAAFSNETKGRIILLKPAIMMPHCLWTGKQVISTLLVNLTRENKPLNMEADAKFTEVLMKASPEELKVRVCQSELVHGVIAKAQFGATDYGLVHCLFELYGSEVAGKFLTMLTRLFTFYMQTHGFTCGIDDMGIARPAEGFRREMESKMMKAAEETADSFVREYGTKSTEGLSTKEQLATMLFRPNLKERFDCAMQSAFNEISKDVIKEIFPLRMMKQFPENCMIMMTQSGAKGSIVNVSQIACLLGQQALEGKRVPIMASGKTLPSFQPMDLSPIAGGFISSRFLTGLKPQEYYFHCMAGREGLVDTAVKTANTGYLQRCIIKHIEGIHVAYDGTVRNADDSVVQFLYGEDGIDPMNNRYLCKFDFMEKNYDAYIRKLHVRDMSDKIDTSADDEILRMKSEGQMKDPIQSIFPPHIHVGSVSENFEAALNSHCEREDHLIDPEKLRGIATLNYFKSIIQPGEVVGIIAAQAIGEPATQMTLNTFHLAGYGGTNVTLGIPRLKEILVVATRTPATPRMRIPLLTDNFDEAKAFVAQFNKVTLREVTSAYTVAEDFFTESEHRRDRQITVELYLKHDKLDELHLATQFIACRIRADFSRALKRRIAAVFKSTGAKIQEVQDDAISKGKSGEKEELSKLKDEELGADLQKIKSRKSEQNSYEKDEDENQDSSKQEKQKEDEITDENINATFDPSSYKITVNYTVANISVKILLESIVEMCLDEVMVHEVPGVSRAVVMRKLDEHNKAVVETEGCNLDAILSRTDVDLNRFYTNDIAQILSTYGIEAARTAIIREVSEVFKAYSISIDPRHLQLIADYVTQSGEWIGMSRHSMKGCASPIQQMSFETTVNFLSQATLHGATDTMGSPSASLTMGNVIKAGTGLCEILVPFE